jgi:hypothetical protein
VEARRRGMRDWMDFILKIVERLLKNVVSECSRVGLLVQKLIHGTDAPSYTDFYIPLLS